MTTTPRATEGARAWHDDVVRFGRNHAPRLLLDGLASGQLIAEDLPAVLPDAWVLPEWPERILSRAWWVEWFRWAGFLTDDADVTAPSEPMTLYRGATQRRARGMSWTSDGAVAQWFADRQRCLLPSATVFTVVAPPDAVLAIFNNLRTGEGGRGETEVVVDPSRLPRTVRWSG